MRDELDIPLPRMAPASPPSYRVSRPGNRMDVATKRLVMVAAIIGGVLLLLVGGWSLDKRRAGGGVPVVEADSRPLRSKPDQPGGMQVAGENESILSGASTDKDAMAPPPEIPAPETLKAEASQQLAAQTAAAKPVAPAIAPAAVAAVPPPPPAAPVVAAAPEPTAPPPARAAVREPTQAAAGPAQVQLAAMTSEQGAMLEWQRLSHKMPDLLATRHPAVLRTERDGKTYFRLRTGGFADVAQATAFCEQMRAKGVGCTLARF